MRLERMQNSSYNKLEIILSAKRNLILGAFVILRSDQLPLEGITQRNLEEMHRKFMETGERKGFEHDPAFAHLFDTPLTVDLNSAWDRATYEKLERYISEHDPEKQLDDLEEALKHLREALEKNFNLADILVDVSSEKYSGLKKLDSLNLLP